MLSDFMRILMEAFVSRSHDLLQEEIVGVVFGMAAVDFDLFHRDFIPHFLLCIPGLDETQRRLLAEGFRDVKVADRLCVCVCCSLSSTLCLGF